MYVCRLCPGNEWPAVSCTGGHGERGGRLLVLRRADGESREYTVVCSSWFLNAGQEELINQTLKFQWGEFHHGNFFFPQVEGDSLLEKKIISICKQVTYRLWEGECASRAVVVFFKTKIFFVISEVFSVQKQRNLFCKNVFTLQFLVKWQNFYIIGNSKNIHNLLLFGKAFTRHDWN